PPPGAVGRFDHPVDGVKDLADGYGGGPAAVGPLVGAGVEDDEILLGGEDRVEQELPVLAASVPLPDQWIAGEQVVAVEDDVAGEGAVVETEQADDPMRDGAYRHHR